jgi:ABC-2 type transport system permease protein
MKRIWVQCIKELAQFQRDHITVALAFILPIVTFLIFSFAVRLEIKNINLIIQDFDSSSLSRAYAETLLATNQFRLVSWSGRDPVSKVIDHDRAKVLLVIPPDFSRRIKANKTSIVQFLVDGTDVNNARVIENTIKSTTDFFLNNTISQPNVEKVTAKIRIWFNPGRKESLYIPSGSYAVIFSVYPPLLAALAMVKEKEQGTIIQIFASSISAVELLLGKGLAYFLISFGEAIIIIFCGSLLFGLWFAGNLIPFLIGTLIFLMTNIMFGLLVGVWADTQSVAVQIVVNIGFLTSLLLSGFIYPLNNVPFPLSLVSYIVPARYYIMFTRDIFVRGAGWQSVWFVPIVLTVMFSLLFIIAWWSLNRMQILE